MSDEEFLVISRTMIIVGLVGMLFAIVFSPTPLWMLSIGFGIAGLLMFFGGVILLVWIYKREETVVIWNKISDAMNAECEGCGTPAILFHPEHEDGARCVVCGGTIKLLSEDENEKTDLEVDDVFTRDRATVAGDAPQGSGD